MKISVNGCVTPGAMKKCKIVFILLIQLYKWKQPCKSIIASLTCACSVS